MNPIKWLVGLGSLGTIAGIPSVVNVSSTGDNGVREGRSLQSMKIDDKTNRCWVRPTTVWREQNSLTSGQQGIKVNGPWKEIIQGNYKWFNQGDTSDWKGERGPWDFMFKGLGEGSSCEHYKEGVDSGWVLRWGWYQGKKIDESYSEWKTKMVNKNAGGVDAVCGEVSQIKEAVQALTKRNSLNENQQLNKCMWRGIRSFDWVWVNKK